jgi:hypothetical protein
MKNKFRALSLNIKHRKYLMDPAGNPKKTGKKMLKTIMSKLSISSHNLLTPKSSLLETVKWEIRLPDSIQ